jgi:hypothetical protein
VGKPKELNIGVAPIQVKSSALTPLFVKAITGAAMLQLEVFRCGI